MPARRRQVPSERHFRIRRRILTILLTVLLRLHHRIQRSGRFLMDVGPSPSWNIRGLTPAGIAVHRADSASVANRPSELIWREGSEGSTVSWGRWASVHTHFAPQQRPIGHAHPHTDAGELSYHWQPYRKLRAFFLLLHSLTPQKGIASVGNRCGSRHPHLTADMYDGDFFCNPQGLARLRRSSLVSSCCRVCGPDESVCSRKTIIIVEGGEKLHPLDIEPSSAAHP